MWAGAIRIAQWALTGLGIFQLGQNFTSDEKKGLNILGFIMIGITIVLAVVGFMTFTGKNGTRKKNRR